MSLPETEVVDSTALRSSAQRWNEYFAGSSGLSERA